MEEQGAQPLDGGSSTEAKRKLFSNKVRGAAGAALIIGVGVGGYVIAGAATTTSSPSTTNAPPSNSAIRGANAENGPPGGAGFGGVTPAVVGTVKSVDTSTKSFTVTGQSGTVVTVDVSSATTYRDKSVTSPSFTNVTVGEQVAVVGTTATSVVTATSVMIGSFGHFGGGMPTAGGTTGAEGVSGTTGRGGRGMPAAFGTVASVNASAKTFTVKTQTGTTVTVDVSTSTTYVDQGVTSPTLADVVVGKRVAVLGATSSGVVTATSVMIGVPSQTNGGSGPGGFGGPGGVPNGGAA